MKLFLSYGHDKNAYIVDRIFADLSSDGHEVWIDKAKIKSGADWRREITDGLLDSDMVFSFASNYSLRSPGVCLDELSIAVSVKGAQIQSVLLEPGVVPPANLSYRQYIDMSSWSAHLETGDFEEWYKGKFLQIKDIIDSPETKKYAEEIEFLRQRLNPDLSNRKKSDLENQEFSDRKWLSDKINQWKDTDSKILVIEGEPGSGKSAFVAHEFLFNDDIGAAIYCEWDNPLMNNTESIARTLVFQLATQLNDYRDLVIQLVNMDDNIAPRYQIRQESGTFQKLLVNPLRQLIDGNRPKTIILIDGLDEISSSGTGAPRQKNALAELLSGEKELFPGWIKFVVTTRPEPAVLKPLKKFDVINLSDYRQNSCTDVNHYLNIKLKSILNDDQMKKAEEKSNGNFLYAKMLADALLNGDIDPDEIASLIDSLSAMYIRNFDRIFNDVENFNDFYYPALCMIGSSSLPLPRKTLFSGMGWNKSQGETFVKKVSQYLNTDNECLRFYHKSFLDWLNSEEAEEYMIDQNVGNNGITRGCLAAYCENKDDMSAYEYLNLLPMLERFGKKEDLQCVLSDTDYAEILYHKSLEAFGRFQYVQAFELVSQSIKIYSNIISNGTALVIEIGNCFIHAAKIRSREINLPECIEWCEQGISFLNSHINTADEIEAKVHEQLGILYLQKAQTERILSSWHDADTSYDRSYEEFFVSGNTSMAMISLNAKALAYRVRKHISDALSCYSTIHSISEYGTLKSKALDLYLILQMSYGWCLQEKGIFQQAYQTLKECEEIYNENPEVLSEADTAQLFYILSLVTYSLQEYEKSFLYVERSLEHEKKAYGDKAVETCNAMNQMGNILGRLDRLEDAADQYSNSVNLRIHYYGKENIYTAISMRNLGRARMQIGTAESIAEADQILNEVFTIRQKLFKEDENQSVIAQSLLDLAELNEAKKDYTTALKFADQAEEIYLRYQEQRDLGTCYMVKGRILSMIGIPEHAREYLEKALHIQKQYYSETHPYMIRINECLSNLYIRHLIRVALDEVGYIEKSETAYLEDQTCLDDKTIGAGEDNYTKYGRDMHEIDPDTMDFPAPWCDAFVDWCFVKAFGTENARKLLGAFDDYTVHSAERFIERKQWYTEGAVPGDQIFFKNDQRICHTGIVHYVDMEYIHTIEGNSPIYNGMVNGGGVIKNRWKHNDSKIAGFGRPDYSLLNS